MGELATAFGRALRDALAARLPDLDWTTERAVGATPVDVVGLDDRRAVAVELEWRRADPADNAAKLFRHLETGSLDAETVVVAQGFTRYYDLADGGVSSKRRNAEFVGRAAERTLPGVRYRPVDVPLDPPRGGGDRPANWADAVAATAAAVADAA